MTDQAGVASVGRFMLIAASVVVVLAGVKAASMIVVPVLLALFITIIFQPVIHWFDRKGLPRPVGVGAVFVTIFVSGTALAALIGHSANEFTRQLPIYREQLMSQFEGLVELAARFNVELDLALVQSQLDPSRLMNLTVNALSSLGGMMTNVVLVLLIVVFMLGEAANLPRKIELAFGRNGKTMSQARELLQAINKYLGLKTIISLITGVLVGLGLWLLGIDHFLLWAVLAFLLNYVPNIGSILAAFPPVVMALVQFNLWIAGLVGLLFLAINLVMGNLIEPRVMGRGLGLSTLVVFLSLIFWGWLLGPVGMLLSVPLTMMVKIALYEYSGTRWVAILLSGDEVAALTQEDSHRL